MLATAFYIFSKIVGVLLLIESWLVLGLLLSLLALWFGKIKTAKRVLSSVFLVLLLVLSPVLDLLFYQLETTYPANPDLQAPTSVHGIVLLGGSVIPGHTQTWQQLQLNEAADRVTTAMQLARRLPKARILISGGSASPFDILSGNRLRSEAQMTVELMAEVGIAKSRFLLEKGSRNTAENATLSASLVGPEKSKRWLLVTSAFHMPRAMRSFEKAGWSDLVAYPVDHRINLNSVSQLWYPAGKIQRANLLIKEVVGLIVYRLTGR